LLKAVAHEAGVPMLAVQGSIFVEVFVGVGASRIRKVFEVAAAAQPCLIALDDLDAFATKRAGQDGRGLVDERAATLLELNNRLDGLTPMPPKVLFIATTSRPDLLDEALVRRFDVRVTLLPGGTSTVEPRNPA
jgi:cell division protease FtsH